jgi:hypothetical protein
LGLNAEIVWRAFEALANPLPLTSCSLGVARIPVHLSRGVGEAGGEGSLAVCAEGDDAGVCGECPQERD